MFCLVCLFICLYCLFRFINFMTFHILCQIILLAYPVKWGKLLYASSLYWIAAVFGDTNQWYFSSQIYKTVWIRYSKGLVYFLKKCWPKKFWSGLMILVGVRHTGVRERALPPLILFCVQEGTVQLCCFGRGSDEPLFFFNDWPQKHI